MSKITKTAVVSVVGRPNVGKSTMTNKLVGQKVAIVSSKPQTTRTRITGVLNRGETQYVFLDTPGLHKPRSRLGDYMCKVVTLSLIHIWKEASVSSAPVGRGSCGRLSSPLVSSIKPVSAVPYGISASTGASSRSRMENTVRKAVTVSAVAAACWTAAQNAAAKLSRGVQAGGALWGDVTAASLSRAVSSPASRADSTWMPYNAAPVRALPNTPLSLIHILNVIHAADIRHLQQFADFLPPGLFFRRAILSGHCS